MFAHSVPCVRLFEGSHVTVSWKQVIATGLCAEDVDGEGVAEKKLVGQGDG